MAIPPNRGYFGILPQVPRIANPTPMILLGVDGNTSGDERRGISTSFFGRLARPETAVIAAMVSDLVQATQDWLGDQHSIDAAVLTSADRMHLTSQEIDDIFDFLKIRNRTSEPDGLENLYAVTAACAGYGHGLCPTYTDVYACLQKERRFPYQDVLHLVMNDESLSGTIDHLQSFRRFWTSAQEIRRLRVGLRPQERLTCDGQREWRKPKGSQPFVLVGSVYPRPPLCFLI